MSYAGRDRLDAAQSRLRRGLSRLARAAQRDPDDEQLVAALSPLLEEAVAALNAIADRAQVAEDASLRNVAALAAARSCLEAHLRQAGLGDV